ncbi:uncharacterized protein EI90DRAFT_2969829 [Cantharellus anzutake]|uniref:uncharacterized protein n=1 Tax=Cantharellus anzutake TaxID=1750568 RepID=UPI00190483AF|nr:uncharacterized protein EI90DRAFT_2969829 [Cantharellus anzutake]KAF8334869.1 hypothetical protein EI90DRAFT_2969829 [Cantharellus anzutake]
MSETTSIPPNPFKPPRRIVTGHTPDGKSTTIFDGEVSSAPNVGTRFWVTKGWPTDNSGDNKDLRDESPDRAGIFQTNGTNFLAQDVPPGAIVPMHRTSTLDYGILISGELTLVLEDGPPLTLSEPGTVFVQRGTAHQWENRGPDWVRVIFVILDAKPFAYTNADGAQVTLEEYHSWSKAPT